MGILYERMIHDKELGRNWCYKELSFFSVPYAVLIILTSSEARIKREEVRHTNLSKPVTSVPHRTSSFRVATVPIAVSHHHVRLL